MLHTTVGDTFVLLCDWHGRLIWSSIGKTRVQIGELVWEHLTKESRERAKAAVARVVTLRENQIIDVSNTQDQHFRAWLWPLESPEVAVCMLGIRIPQELTRLTEREQHCLRLLGQGLSTRKIAAEMDISLSTVHTHFKRSREKLQISSGEALIAFAARHCQPQANPIEGKKKAAAQT